MVKSLPESARLGEEFMAIIIGWFTILVAGILVLILVKETYKGTKSKKRNWKRPAIALLTSLSALISGIVYVKNTISSHEEKAAKAIEVAKNQTVVMKVLVMEYNGKFDHHRTEEEAVTIEEKEMVDRGEFAVVIVKNSHPNKTLACRYGLVAPVEFLVRAGDEKKIHLPPKRVVSCEYQRVSR